MEQVDLAAFHVQCASESDGHVHEVRKATKRLRAVLRMVRDELGIDMYREVNVAVRDISRTLSHARSSAVMVDLFEDLVSENPALTSIGASMHGGLHADRERGRLAVDEALMEDLGWQLAGVRSRLVAATWTGEGTVSLRGVQRTYRRGRHGMAHAFATGSAESLHVWRKQVKYLRHQLEVLSEVGSSDVAALAEDLEALGEDLGRDNDLADLTHWVSDFGSRGERDNGSEALLEAITHARIGIESTMREPADQAFHRTPSTFLRESLPVLA